MDGDWIGISPMCHGSVENGAPIGFSGSFPAFSDDDPRLTTAGFANEKAHNPLGPFDQVTYAVTHPLR